LTCAADFYGKTTAAEQHRKVDRQQVLRICSAVKRALFTSLAMLFLFFVVFGDKYRLSAISITLKR